MRAHATILIALLATLPLAGCVENMSDLRDQLQGSNVDVDVNGTDPDGILNQTKNATGEDTKKKLLPVARIQVFEKGGAKLYHADFVAADAKVEVAAQAGKELSFIASESTPGAADIVQWDWSLGDGTTVSGQSVTHAYGATGGVFTITLKVTDAKARSDVQSVQLAVKPARFTENATAEGTIQAGNGGQDGTPLADQGADRATVAFTIAAAQDGTDLKHISTALELSGDQQAVDIDLYVYDAAGELVASSAGSGASESLLLEGLAAGDYVAEIVLRVGFQASYALVIETTYEPINHEVEAFLGGDGHGHAH